MNYNPDNDAILRAAGFEITAWSGSNCYATHISSGRDFKFDRTNILGSLVGQGFEPPSELAISVAKLRDEVKRMSGDILDLQNRLDSASEVLARGSLSKKMMLCYADDDDSGSVLTVWFTSDFKNQTGDDWNDAPWWCNAGVPYASRASTRFDKSRYIFVKDEDKHSRKHVLASVEIPSFSKSFELTAKTLYNGVSVDDINGLSGVWFRTGVDFKPKYGADKFFQGVAGDSTLKSFLKFLEDNDIEFKIWVE